MYQFTTASGAAYKVHNGRITRVEGRIPIQGMVGVPLVDELIVSMPRPPVVGQSCLFYTPTFHMGLTTSIVREVVR